MRRRILGVTMCWLFGVSIVHAQPPLAERAKARWTEGARALARGDADGARLAFQEAYDLVPDPELAQSLGEVEVRTGHFAEAARHLSRALENRQLPAEERRGTAKSLEKALAHVGQLFVEMDMAGCEIRIDGQIAPVTLPMHTPWYLDPGAHTISVRKDGFLEATESVMAIAGQETRASLTLSPELHQALFPPAFPAKNTGPPQKPTPPPAPEPEPSSAPPTRWIIGESAVALAMVGLGGYFAWKPGSDGSDKIVAGACVANGVFIGGAVFVVWWVTRPKPPAAASPQAVSVDLPRLRVLF